MKKISKYDVNATVQRMQAPNHITPHSGVCVLGCRCGLLGDDWRMRGYLAGLVYNLVELGVDSEIDTEDTQAVIAAAEEAPNCFSEAISIIAKVRYNIFDDIESVLLPMTNDLYGAILVIDNIAMELACKPKSRWEYDQVKRAVDFLRAVRDELREIYDERNEEDNDDND